MGFTTILDHAYHLDRPAKSVKPHKFIDIRSIFHTFLIFTIALPTQPLMSHTKHHIRAINSLKAIEPVSQAPTKATTLPRANAFVGREPSRRDRCATQVPLTTQRFDLRCSCIHASRRCDSGASRNRTVTRKPDKLSVPILSRLSVQKQVIQHHEQHNIPKPFKNPCLLY